ncbi:hypothetical protein [Paenibacillus monticola]|uniref:Uncharacterized protein n=1 Tax=Paenibacillus monticola TaxID=2666075 RepID=A0A7X2H4P0_9BACL|nr:hypothetical protein [Paenibacillus monticola]MRN53479.1 hypothetical protein [Paenibacillus monticola]
MKKILSRIAMMLLLFIFVAIVVCFYLNQFMYAYGLILVLFIVFAGIGQLSKLKNDEYMYHKLSRTDEYEDYTR